MYTGELCQLTTPNDPTSNEPTGHFPGRSVRSRGPLCLSADHLGGTFHPVPPDRYVGSWRLDVGSIDNPFEKPSVGGSLAKQPVGRAAGERDIPLVAVPGIRDSGLGARGSGLGTRDSGFGIRDLGYGARGSAFPPRARCTPGAGARIDGSPTQSPFHDRHVRRPSLLYIDPNGHGVTEATNRNDRRSCFFLHDTPPLDRARGALTLRQA